MTKVSSGAIVAAARELFRNCGYSGASMQDLADRVGIRKASLYSRFPNKETLIGKVLDLTLAELFPTAPAETDWRTAYKSMIGRLAGHLRSHRKCVALHLAYGLTEEENRTNAEVQSFFGACRERLAAILRGGLDAELADELAVESIVRIEGATLWLVVYADESPLERAVAALNSQVDAIAIAVPSPEARHVLDALTGDWRQASAAEKALATRLAEAEERAFFVEQALRGQIEAESCFR